MIHTSLDWPLNLSLTSSGRSELVWSFGFFSCPITTLSSSGAESGDDASPESDDMVEADDSTETFLEQ